VDRGDDRSEAQVWAAASAGDADAFGMMFDAHQARAHRHACRLVGDVTQAQDVTATAFLELWRRRSEVRMVDGSVLPWLLVTVTNVARNTRRSTRRYRALLDRLPHAEITRDTADEALDRLGVAGLAPGLAAGLVTLKPVDQALLSLVALEGYSIADAAKATGLTQGAAKTRLSRARAGLRAARAPTRTAEGAIS